MVQRWHPKRMVRWWLFFTAVLTLPYAATSEALGQLAVCIGVASAVVFQYHPGMSQLAHLGKPALGGLVFCGPGIGIVVTGLATSGGWLAGGQRLAGVCAAGRAVWLLVLPCARHWHRCPQPSRRCQQRLRRKAR